jgi:hypothetical protein
MPPELHAEPDRELRNARLLFMSGQGPAGISCGNPLISLESCTPKDFQADG